jgi:hypothetical protein
LFFIEVVWIKQHSFVIENKREPCRKLIGNNVKNIEIKVFFKEISEPKGILKINLIFCKKIKDVKEKSIRRKLLEKTYLISFLTSLK